MCFYLFFLFLLPCFASAVAVCSKPVILANSSSSCLCMCVSSVACRSEYLILVLSHTLPYLTLPYQYCVFMHVCTCNCSSFLLILELIKLLSFKCSVVCVWMSDSSLVCSCFSVGLFSSTDTSGCCLLVSSSLASSATVSPHTYTHTHTHTHMYEYSLATYMYIVH